MPLLLLDLDNTLIDRADAYRHWAQTYLRERGADPGLLEAMITADGDGLRPKPEVALDLTDLLGLDANEAAQIVAVLRAGVLDHLRADPEVERALLRALDAGWTPFIITNGVVAQQEGKISRLGLDRLVDGWVISDAAGMRKPDPEIFQIAARQAGQSLDGAWMIGDSAEADIAGAQNAGVASIYLRRGRAWDPALPEPTRFADSFTEAVEIVLSSASATDRAHPEQPPAPPRAPDAVAHE